MKESSGEGPATHADPESCGAVCKDRVEALTGARAGRVFSRERNTLWDADAVGESGRPHQAYRYREIRLGPTRSETPCTYGDTSRGSREVPCSPVAVGLAGRVGKSKDVRRR
jgi:hypothetical protein